MAATPIHQAIADLPESNFTTRLLKTLDYITPGEWKNITSFEAMIKEVTGEDDQAYVQQIGEHAMALYADSSQGYQRALRIFRLVDDLDKVAGAAALANQAAERVSFLSFLKKITPKDETTQVIDAGVELAAELAAFCSLNGLPGDSVGEFAKSLKRYAGSDAARLAAWIAVDGVLPLGPNFIDLVSERIQGMGDGALSQNSLFAKVAEFLPGGTAAEKKGLIVSTLAQTKDTVQGFINGSNVTQGGIAGKLKGFVEMTDDRLDLVAAGLDMTTNYFEHTGTQSVARQLIDRAYGGV